MTKIATREAYGKALAKLICEDERIVVLDADLTKSTKTSDAKQACPERHFNIGIAEANMMSIAAGLAVGVAILLAAKEPLHGFVKVAVTRNELNDFLILAAATLIIQPSSRSLSL